MALSSILFGGLATLFATLIGVLIAFKLDRRAEDTKKRKRVLQHMRAVQKELNQNEEIGWGNHSLIRELQEMDEPEADHYAPNLFMTDAWDAAIEDQLIDLVPAELYYELQGHHHDIKSTNELIRRLRIEAVDPRIGELVHDGSWEYINWTYSVYYYDHDSEEVDHLGLGPLILHQCGDLAGDSNQLQQSLDNVIEEIESSLQDGM